MKDERNNQSILPSTQSGRPSLPSCAESLNLSPVEAHTILTDHAGKKMSKVDREALRRIADSDEPDYVVDSKTVRKRVADELDSYDD